SRDQRIHRINLCRNGRGCREDGQSSGEPTASPVSVAEAANRQQQSRHQIGAAISASTELTCAATAEVAAKTASPPVSQPRRPYLSLRLPTDSSSPAI